MTTQVSASVALFPWAAELQSRLGSQPLAAHQREALARSAQAQSIPTAVLALTDTVGYTAMPCFKHVGQLKVHPRAHVVTTPGGFRVSLREGNPHLQSPTGSWIELEAQLASRPITWGLQLTENPVLLLLPDGTRLTLRCRKPRSACRVAISHGNQHLVADSALAGPLWQPVQDSARFTFWDAPRESSRYEAMIDNGLSSRPRPSAWRVSAMNRLAASAAPFLKAYAATPQRWDQLQETFRARQSQSHLPVVTAVGDRECLPILSGGPGGAAALWGHDVPFDLPSRFAQMRNAVSELLLLALDATSPGDPTHEPDADPTPRPAAPFRGGPGPGCEDARLPPGRGSARGPLRAVP